MFTLSFLSVLLVSLVAYANAVARIDPQVLKELEDCDTTDVLLEFGDDKVVEALQRYAISQKSSNNRIFDEFIQQVQKIAEESQAEVISFLSEAFQGYRYGNFRTSQLWITNELGVRNVNKTLVDKLAEMGKVMRIKSDLPLRMQLAEAKKNVEGSRVAGREGGSPPWSVKEVRVPEVWAKGNRGKGVVVGIIDTGFLFKHKAIADGFRSDHGWFDAVNGKDEPYDDNDDKHGTAVLCSAVGRTFDIGIAPEAQWIGCKGVSGDGYGRYSEVKKCMEFMVCPTDPQGQNPDCSKRAGIVSHSIALDDPVGEGVDYSKFFNVYEAAGMLVAHMAGNYLGCGTITREAAEDYVLTVASSFEGSRFFRRHAQGPTPDGRIKPDVIAPGAYVPTCDPDDENRQSMYTGTSFSSPIVAGIGALLLSVHPNLTQQEFKSIITSTARSPEPDPKISQCGDTPVSTVPNNMFGHGIVDADAAYEQILKKKERVRDVDCEEMTE